MPGLAEHPCGRVLSRILECRRGTVNLATPIGPPMRRRSRPLSPEYTVAGWRPRARLRCPARIAALRVDFGCMDRVWPAESSLTRRRAGSTMRRLRRDGPPGACLVVRQRLRGRRRRRPGGSENREKRPGRGPKAAARRPRAAPRLRKSKRVPPFSCSSKSRKMSIMPIRRFGGWTSNLSSHAERAWTVVVESSAAPIGVGHSRGRSRGACWQARRPVGRRQSHRQDGDAGM
jgi:hypothetical protein